MRIDDAARKEIGPFNNLFVKIAGGVLAVSMLLWATNYVLNGHVSRVVATASVAGKVALATNLLSSDLAGAVRFGDQEGIARRVQSVLTTADDRFAGIAVLNASGVVLHIAGTEDGFLVDIGRRAIDESNDISEAEGLLNAVPIKAKDGSVVGALAVAGKTEAELALVAMHATMVFGWDALALAAGMLVFAFGLRQQVTTPLNGLRRAVMQIADRNYDVDLPAAARGDEIGAISRNVVSLRDKLREAAEQSRMALYQSAAFSGASVPMLMTDASGHVVALNDTFAALAAGHRDTLISRWPQFAANSLIGEKMSDMGLEEQVAADVPAKKAGGTHRKDIVVGDVIFEIFAQEIVDEDGAFAGHILEWQDVTGQRENAGVIRALEQSQGFMTVDADRRISEANAIVSEWSEHSHQDLIGSSLDIFRDPDDDSMDGLWASALAGKLAQAQISRRDKSGHKRWLDLTLAPVMDANGGVFRVIEFSADVTDEHTAKAEAAERDARKSQAQAKAVGALGLALSSLAQGDLTADLAEPFEGEYDRLRTDFNAAVAGLRAAISDIVEVSVNILGGAGEIARASDDLSRRTENQAATLEQTAAALDEITSSVKSTADDSEGADKAVAAARESAKSGGAVVLEAVDAMNEIESSSDQISKIITVIDDIAFQTNLLALNAGVEAARAGEAGRGFAVVASEVRALAQRSSEAAKQIKGLISTSAQHVKNGVALVGKSGDALTHIVESVENISSLIASIAAASRDQSTGLSEINAGVVQLDDVTQQNAAMVEEATAAGHAMRSEAERLGELVASFRLGTETIATDRAQATTWPPEPAGQSGRPSAAFSKNFVLEPSNNRNAVAAGAGNGWEEF